MYSEDVDLFARIGAAGYPGIWVSDAPVTHPYPADPDDFSRRRQTEVVHSELRYMRKHFGRTGAAVYRLGVALDAGSRMLVFSVPLLARSARQQGMGRTYNLRAQSARLAAAISSGTRPGLAELADEWNRRRQLDEALVG